jgi:hypothetical protein
MNNFIKSTLVVLTLILTSCGLPDNPSDKNGTGTSGSVQLSITDNMSENSKDVWIMIESISADMVHPKQMLVPIIDKPFVTNIRNLAGTIHQISRLALPIGEYKNLTINLAPNSIRSDFSDNITTLSIINNKIIVPDYKFSVNVNQTTNINLDFDLSKWSFDDATNKLNIPADSVRSIGKEEFDRIPFNTFEFEAELISIGTNRIKVLNNKEFFSILISDKLFNSSSFSDLKDTFNSLSDSSTVAKNMLVYISGKKEKKRYVADLIIKRDSELQTLIYGKSLGHISSNQMYDEILFSVSNVSSSDYNPSNGSIILKINKDLISSSKSCILYQRNVPISAMGTFSSDTIFDVSIFSSPDSSDYKLEPDIDGNCQNSSTSGIIKSVTGTILNVSLQDLNFSVDYNNINITNGDSGCLKPGSLIEISGPSTNPININVLQGCPSTFINNETKNDDFVHFSGKIESSTVLPGLEHSTDLNGSFTVLSYKGNLSDWISPDASKITFIPNDNANAIIQSSNLFGSTAAFHPLGSAGDLSYFTIFNKDQNITQLVQLKAFPSYLHLTSDSNEEVIIRSNASGNIDNLKYIQSISLVPDNANYIHSGSTISALPPRITLDFTNIIRLSVGSPLNLPFGANIDVYGTFNENTNILLVDKIIFPENSDSHSMDSQQYQIPSPLFSPELINEAASNTIKTTILFDTMNHFLTEIPDYEKHDLLQHYNPSGTGSDLTIDNELFSEFLASNFIDPESVFIDGVFDQKSFNSLYLLSIINQITTSFSNDDNKQYTNLDYIKMLENNYFNDILDKITETATRVDMVKKLSKDKDSPSLSIDIINEELSNSNKTIESLLKDDVSQNIAFRLKYLNLPLSETNILVDPRSETMDKINVSRLYNDIANNLGCPSVPLDRISDFSDNVLTINTSQDFTYSGENILKSFVYPMESLQYLVLEDNLVVKDELDNPVDFDAWLSFNAPVSTDHSLTTLTMSDRESLFGKLLINVDSANNTIIPFGDYKASIGYSILTAPNPQTSPKLSGILHFAINVDSSAPSINILTRSCPGLSDFLISDDAGTYSFDVSKIFNSGIISDKLTLDLNDSDKSVLLNIIDGSKGDILDERKIRTIVNFTPPTLTSSEIKIFIDSNFSSIYKRHILNGFSFATDSDAKSSYPLRIDKSKVFKLLVKKYEESLLNKEYIIEKSGNLDLREFLDNKLGIALSKTIPITSDSFVYGVDYTDLKNRFIFANSLSNKLIVRSQRINNINKYYKNKFNINLNLSLDAEGKISVKDAVESFYDIIKGVDFNSFYSNKVISHDINRIYSSSFSIYQDGYNSVISDYLKYLNEFNSSLTSSDITDSQYNSRYRTPTLSLNYYKYLSQHYSLMDSNRDFFIAATLRDLIRFLTIDINGSNSHKIDNFNILFNHNNFFGYNYLALDSQGKTAEQYISTQNLSSTTIGELNQQLSDLNLSLLNPSSSDYKQFYSYNNYNSNNQLKAYLHKIIKRYNPLLNAATSSGYRQYNNLNFNSNSLVRSLSSVFLYRGSYNYFLPIIGSSVYDDYGYGDRVLLKNYTILPQVIHTTNFYTGLSSVVQCYIDDDYWYDWRSYCNRLGLDAEYVSKYYSLNSYLNYFPPIDGSRKPSKYANTENFTYKSFSLLAKYFPGFHPYMISSETGFISRALPSLLPDLMKTTMYKKAFANFLAHQAANELSGLPVTHVTDYRTFVLDIID